MVSAEPIQLKKSDMSWREKGGTALESALQIDPKYGDSPVALVDAHVVVELWKTRWRDPPPAGPPKGRLSTSRRSRGCLLAAAISATPVASSPSRTGGSSPTTRTLKEVNLALAKVLERFLAGGRARLTPCSSSARQRACIGRCALSDGTHLRVLPLTS